MPNWRCTTPISTFRSSSQVRRSRSAGASARTFGCRRAGSTPLGTFDTQKDIQFFDDEPQTYYTLRPGQFTMLLPEDGHAPMVGEGHIRKIIVKVRR